RQVDPGRLREAERTGVLDDRRRADLEPRLIEEDVAGVYDGLVEIHQPVPAFLPVLERERAQAELAVAERAVEGRDAPLLQARRGDDDLEHGPGRVLALDGAVQQREVRVLDHAQPRLAFDGPGE